MIDTIVQWLRNLFHVAFCIMRRWFASRPGRHPCSCNECKICYHHSIFFITPVRGPWRKKNYHRSCFYEWHSWGRVGSWVALMPVSHGESRLVTSLLCLQLSTDACLSPRQGELSCRKLLNNSQGVYLFQSTDQAFIWDSLIPFFQKSGMKTSKTSPASQWILRHPSASKVAAEETIQPTSTHCKQKATWNKFLNGCTIVSIMLTLQYLYYIKYIPLPG